MNTCCTCSTDVKSFDLGIPLTDLSPTRRPGEKLEFVEHILGVLIDSRYGNDNPYTRLGERPVTTGHSQMFANVRLLSAAEIDAHLELPLGLPNGSWGIERRGFSPKTVWAKAREIVAALNRWLKLTAIPLDPASSHLLQPPVLARGSPTFSGTCLLDSFGFAVSHYGEAMPLQMSG